MRKDLQLYGKIQARRKALGMSQEELAQRMGVSRQSVTKWETGLSAPDLDRLVELADTLGVSLDYLLREQADGPEAAAVSVEQGEAAPAESPAEEKNERESAPPAPASTAARHIALAAGVLVFLIGAGGLLTMWIYSELFPVQLVDGRGGVHTGLWGYVLARDVKALFWAALAAMASGAALLGFTLRRGRG
ncbi:helix-turn-helix domain-containing protein [Mailhella massiliensis]|uniref:Helix-turn-helix domain-containing protein n=1 Tax=Mailhella massiliensis TaxID=1903261 RepID=A0A921DRZ2_9BACT|nr:helix-turn-helix transcriptional regulator [Mailhella massiliensis]HJD97608.1 helix-turn-helix domain-containing protein [Mailhella massiliensis]